jgi:hypothetical protein
MFPFILGGGNVGEAVVRYHYALEVVQWTIVLIGIWMLAKIRAGRTENDNDGAKQSEPPFKVPV